MEIAEKLPVVKATAQSIFQKRRRKQRKRWQSKRKQPRHVQITLMRTSAKAVVAAAGIKPQVLARRLSPARAMPQRAIVQKAAVLGTVPLARARQHVQVMRQRANVLRVAIALGIVKLAHARLLARAILQQATVRALDANGTAMQVHARQPAGVMLRKASVQVVMVAHGMLLPVVARPDAQVTLCRRIVRALGATGTRLQAHAGLRLLRRVPSLPRLLPLRRHQHQLKQERQLR
jgi:hypothetical protein